MSLTLDMNTYMRMPQEMKDRVHLWCDQHGIDYKRCSGVEIVGDEVRFTLLTFDDRGKWTGRHQTDARRLLFPSPWTA